MLGNCRVLREKQKRFLKEQGLNPEEYKVIASLADCYKFYHVESGQEVIIRR
ncbi:MAG: hypothetical protein KH415_16010 [Clostridium sp.]|nr:hypothetical protein [Clostridium sp.]